jgi:hypothetical protein
MQLGIRARLFAAFGAVLLLLSAVGGFAVLSLRQGVEATQELADVEIARVVARFHVEDAAGTVVARRRTDDWSATRAPVAPRRAV